jgi:hypothetical protein
MSDYASLLDVLSKIRLGGFYLTSVSNPTLCTGYFSKAMLSLFFSISRLIC